jgi:hypothetical protein
MPKCTMLVGALVTLGILCLSYLSWNKGFETGVDTSLCVVTHLQTKRPVKEIESCGRVNPNTPYYILRRNLPENWK